MTRYTHEYIDYIRSYMTTLMSKSLYDRTYDKIAFAFLDYFSEIVRVSGDYTYNDLWNCQEITTHQPFVSFYEKHKNEFSTDLERTIISYMLENQ